MASQPVEDHQVAQRTRVAGMGSAGARCRTAYSTSPTECATQYAEPLLSRKAARVDD